MVVLFFGILGNNIYRKTVELRDAFCQWDCEWYMGIIKNGYQLVPSKHITGDAANWAYFPIFPKTIDLLSSFFSVHPVTTALILNNLVFLFGLYTLYLYVQKIYNSQIALTTIILFAFSPYSIYLSVPYTESLFFLFMILVFYFMIEKKWIYAGVFAALLSGTRGVGVMIVFPMLMVAIQQFGFKSLVLFKSIYSYRVAFAILLAPIGLFLYMNYLHSHMGDALAFKNIQVAWGKQFQNPFGLLYKSLEAPWDSYQFYSAVMTILGLMLIAFLFYRQYPEAIYMIIVTLIPLSTHYYSMPRYIFTMFPVYIVFALMIYKYDTLKQIIVALFGAGLAFMSVSWVTQQFCLV